MSTTPITAATAPTRFKPQLDWSAYEAYGEGDAYAQIPASGGAFGKAAAVCIGNRQCQRDDKGVMCPSFRVTHDTAHSTQHRAATLKAALNGELGARPFASPQLAEAMDLCMACKGCKRECPNGVDMALLRAETQAQRWADGARITWRHRLFADVPRWAPALSACSGIVNMVMTARERWPWLARLGERWLGIAAQRSLPRVQARSFLDQTSDALPAADDAREVERDVVREVVREVVLLIDTFSNHFDTDTAQAALDVLRAAGYRVHLARSATGERPLCCGRTWFSSGLIEQARAQAQRTLDALWPFVERGLPIVGLEPSCLLMLRDEYLSLGLGERAQRLAKSAWLLEEFLAREHDGKRLNLPLKALPRHAVVHGHCHQKAFGAMKAMRKVLGLVPELKVEFIESSCCGMAGSFGLEAEHHAVSMQMAELALLPAVRAANASTTVIANGTSCRHQIRDGAQREGRHLAQVLRDALA